VRVFRLDYTLIATALHSDYAAGSWFCSLFGLFLTVWTVTVWITLTAPSEMPNRCAAFGCKSGYKKQDDNEPKLTFHSFPSDKQLLAKWNKANPRKDFEPSQSRPWGEQRGKVVMTKTCQSMGVESKSLGWIARQGNDAEDMPIKGQDHRMNNNASRWRWRHAY